MSRDTWSTRSGFILAAVGSAVGLGNVWRFPWMTAENGGSAFLIVYLLVVLLVGVPGLLGEFVIGRQSRRNPVGALRSLGGSDRWGVVGLFSVLTALFLLSFYSVVGGWLLRYFVDSFGGAYLAGPAAHFEAISFGPEAVAFHVVFLALTAAIVYGGVRDGIEAATRVMMPAILVLLVGLAVWASTLAGAGAGYDYYLAPDLGYLQAHWFDVLLSASGQALFTLSVGAGAMLTYASYFDEERSLPVDGAAVAILNTTVGVLAGLVVFPLLFSVGTADPSTSGPGALFVSIAGAFGTIPGGRVVAVAFFGVVVLAAISSSISMLEIPVAYLVDERGLGRSRATAGLTAVYLVTGSVCALYPAVFDFVAGTLVDLLLTAGLLAFLVFVGWVLGASARAEFERGSAPAVRQLSGVWLFAVGVVLPVFLLFTLFSGLADLAGFRLEPAPLVVAAAVVALGGFALLRRPSSVV